MSSEGRPANNTGKDTDSAIGTGRGVLRPGALCDVIMKPKKQREVRFVPTRKNCKPIGEPVHVRTLGDVTT